MEEVTVPNQFRSGLEQFRPGMDHCLKQTSHLIRAFRPPTSPPSPIVAGPFPFMSLPPEVRQLVYAECLVVGKVFPYTVSERYHEYDNDDDDEETSLDLSDCEVPSVALLLVCKQIYDETVPMLYQRNTFVLPACDLTNLFFKRSLHNDLRKSWVKSVELGFDAGDLTKSDREEVLDAELQNFRNGLLFPEKCGDGVMDNAGGNFAQTLHEAYSDRLGDVVWPRKASYVLDNLTLQKIHLDFSLSSCIEGCCSLSGRATQAMKRGFAKGIAVEVKVTGLGKATKPYKEVVGNWTSIRRKEVNLYEDVDMAQVYQELPEL